MPQNVLNYFVLSCPNIHRYFDAEALQRGILGIAHRLRKPLGLLLPIRHSSHSRGCSR